MIDWHTLVDQRIVTHDQATVLARHLDRSVSGVFSMIDMHRLTHHDDVIMRRVIEYLEPEARSAD